MLSMTKEEVAKYIDHTLLAPQAGIREIVLLCQEAKRYNFASVCVNPVYVSAAADELSGSDVKVCTVVGFPLGATTTKDKISESVNAIANGADESETLISCMANDTGFVIKPQYVELKTSAIVSQHISNDEIHEVTFVYYGNSEGSGIYRGLQAIYIDGTIQTIAAAGAFVPHTTSIAVTATTASVYLYSVKAFRRALSFTEIQSLYCFNQSDTEAISSYVLENDIFKTNTTAIGDYGQSIDRTKLPKDSVVLILYGREDNPTPWATINSYAMSEENKKAKHALAGAHLYTVGYTAHPINFYMVGGCLGAQRTS